jgi:hypothetical protein
MIDQLRELLRANLRRRRAVKYAHGERTRLDPDPERQEALSLLDQIEEELEQYKAASAESSVKVLNTSVTVATEVKKLRQERQELVGILEGWQAWYSVQHTDLVKFRENKNNTEQWLADKEGDG